MDYRVGLINRFFELKESEKKVKFSRLYNNFLVFSAKKCDFFSVGINLWYLKCNMYSLMWVRKWSQMTVFRRWITVCGYKFNHMATNLTTLAAFRLASLKGQPLLLEGWSENRNIRQNTNKGACFWNFELSFFIWILWGF